MAKPTTKDPNGNPSAPELGEQKAWLRDKGFPAAQAAQLNMGNTRRQNGAIIAGWNRPARAQGNGK
jgi:hypothetical protein